MSRKPNSRNPQVKLAGFSLSAELKYVVLKADRVVRASICFSAKDAYKVLRPDEAKGEALFLKVGPP